jgi:hypothetical protein
LPTWGELLLELGQLVQQFQVRVQQLQFAGQQLPPNTPSPHDTLRRKYLAQLNAVTGRPVIIYETAFLESRQIDPTDIMVHLGDIPGFMEVCSNIAEREVDLILHSPGGQAEAAESIIKYLRSRFSHIRVIVPHAAMSAARMMALGADEIVMGQHSQLGPIDPQFTLQTPEGPRGAPGQAILDQFEKAKAECKDPNNLAAWLPILRMYGPGLLANIQHQHSLAQNLVATWLEAYMFRGRANKHELARAAAEWFSNFDNFKSHGRPVHRDDVRGLKLRITPLERDRAFQDAVLSAHHATQLTLGGTPAAKVIENHHGRAFIKMTQVFGVGMPIQIPIQIPAQPMPSPLQPPRVAPVPAPAIPSGPAPEDKKAP